MEMIVREIEGKEYKFKMTRKAVRMAEKNGLSVSDEIHPMTLLYSLWYASIWAEQPMTKAKADDLLDAYLDDEKCDEKYSDLMENLMSQYTEVFE